MTRLKYISLIRKEMCLTTRQGTVLQNQMLQDLNSAPQMHM